MNDRFWERPDIPWDYEGDYLQAYNNPDRPDAEDWMFSARHRYYSREKDYADPMGGGYRTRRGFGGRHRFDTDFWWQPGPYTGVGPIGYQRSDARIENDVCDRLSLAGQLDASQIEVQTEDGEVTLQGTVSSRRMKRLAETIAESVSGVIDVHNQLRISSREQFD